MWKHDMKNIQDYMMFLKIFLKDFLLNRPEIKVMSRFSTGWIVTQRSNKFPWFLRIGGIFIDTLEAFIRNESAQTEWNKYLYDQQSDH